MRARQQPEPTTALVTGGSRGLGLAIARELGLQGHRVVVTARSATELDRAKHLLESDGITVRTRVHDVRDGSAATNLIAETEAEQGPIETLIVVAGVLQVGPLPHIWCHIRPRNSGLSASAGDWPRSYTEPVFR
jgi:ketoreductase